MEVASKRRNDEDLFLSICSHLYLSCDDCVCYNEDFVILRIFPHTLFTGKLAGLKSIVRNTKDFTLKSFVKSRFHCSKFRFNPLYAFC